MPKARLSVIPLCEILFQGSWRTGRPIGVATGAFLLMKAFDDIFHWCRVYCKTRRKERTPAGGLGEKSRVKPCESGFLSQGVARLG
jgi:hypothetical protein